MKNHLEKIILKSVFAVFLFLVSGVSFAQESTEFKVSRNIIKEMQKKQETNTALFTVTQNQKEIYSIRLNLEYDVPIPALTVFENGESVMISSLDASLSFFNNSGIKIKKLKIRKDLNLVYERSIYSAIDEDHLVITLSQPGLDYSLLQMYDETGALLDEWNIDNAQVNGLQYLKSKDIVAVSSYNWASGAISKTTQFFDKSGDLLQEIGYGFTSGRFAKNGEMFFGHSNRLYFLYDVNLKKAVFQFTTTDKIIITADYKSDRITIVTTQKLILDAGTWYYKNPTIKTFSPEGIEISVQEEETTPFSTFSLEQTIDGIFFKTNNENILIE